MTKANRGLFVDLDGTLADSIPMLRQAYHAFLGDFGRQGSEAEFQRLNGPPLRRIVQLLRDTHGLGEDCDDLLGRYLALLRDGHDAMRPADGAEEVLTLAGRLGFKVAVVTSSPRHSTLSWLRRVGLERYLDEVVCGDDVIHGKPDPEPYRLALQRTGCSPERSLAVEDSAQGAAAACGAGLPLWFLGPAAPADLAATPTFRGCLSRFGDLTELLLRLEE